MSMPDRPLSSAATKEFRSSGSSATKLETTREHQRVGGNVGGDVVDFKLNKPKTVSYWVKSSLSFSNGNCVELAWLEQDKRGLRDSKNPNGGMLSISPKALKTFLQSIQSGKFSHV